MYAAFAKLLNMSLSASVLVLVILLFRVLFRRTSKKIICMLWMLVAVRLICPVSIRSSVSAFNLLNSKQTGAEQAFQFEYTEKSEKPTITFAVPALVNDDQAPESMTIGMKKPDFYVPVAGIFWVFGVMIMLIAALSGYLNLKKEVRASILRGNGIRVCDEIQSPFILGMIRPIIYLPSGMDREVERNVLLHEQAHIHRLDHLWKPLGYLLLSIHWFNPVMWLAFIFLCRDIEAACDEMVIAGMDRERISDYTESLLLCAAMRRRITACPVAFGETNVKGRVRFILNYKKPAVWVSGIAVMTCAAVTACFMTDPSADGLSTEEEKLVSSLNKIVLSSGDGFMVEDISWGSTPADAADKLGLESFRDHPVYQSGENAVYMLGYSDLPGYDGMVYAEVSEEGLSALRFDMDYIEEDPSAVYQAMVKSLTIRYGDPAQRSAALSEEKTIWKKGSSGLLLKYNGAMIQLALEKNMDFVHTDPISIQASDLREADGSYAVSGLGWNRTEEETMDCLGIRFYDAAFLYAGEMESYFSKDQLLFLGHPASVEAEYHDGSLKQLSFRLTSSEPEELFSIIVEDLRGSLGEESRTLGPDGMILGYRWEQTNETMTALSIHKTDAGVMLMMAEIE